MLKRLGSFAISGCLALVLGTGPAAAGGRPETIVPALKPDLAMDGIDAAAEAEMDEGSLRDLVSDAQRMLTLGGFDPGPVDGRLGLRTRRAIQAYQEAARMNRAVADLKQAAPPRPELVGGQEPPPLAGKD